ncbi:MAG: PIN domain-containing protein [Candidatus Asgardarchaeia archaeon]
MRLVVDTNKLLAAFLKNGIVRSILLLSKHEFYTLDYAIFEIEKHKDELLKRIHVKREQFQELMFELILKNVIVIRSSYIEDLIDDALEICKSFDPDDAPFIALALKLDIPIWSNDKDLREKQDVVPVVTTAQIV